MDLPYLRLNIELHNNGGVQLVIRSIPGLILHVTHYKIGVLSLVELFGDIKKLITCLKKKDQNST